MWIIIAIFTIICLGIYFIKNKKTRKQKAIDVSQKYKCYEGDFVVVGKKDNFKITKDNQFEFLVKDGQIVATKDLKVSDEFVYYGGK
nr:hypothetical protein [uncultured Intestinibacter sp.]